MKKIKNNFDIFVVGGGHAGLEAAWISSQFGFNVGLASIKGVGLGSTPCNPAIGGVGKGQVVREIDALGGLMGKLADLAGIQYRTLNESKGYAVHSTRTQVDKDLYSKNAEDLIEKSNVSIIRDKLVSIRKEGLIFFLLFESKIEIQTNRLIMTTGTFLGGVLHTGDIQTKGGRVNCPPSGSLNKIFSKVKTLPKRFKTGTPARIKKDSINYAKLEIQPSDDATPNFHYSNLNKQRHIKQLDCYLTRTNEKTLTIIRENKERSPIFNGQIEGVGPRYCPSIEDKAFRYPDRNSHHVFIEPEGIEADTIYPNGASTSLPKDVQQDFYRTIDGLESCEIKVYGYAVEYDVVDTTELTLGLEHREIEGLYFAGQVNGTSGYEEAAGQGLMAGINCSFKLLGRDLFILDRNDSYIGVMIEDLVTQKRDEPYRLFTARAEARLYIREDNTILRMASYRSLFKLKMDIDLYQENFIKEFNLLMTLIENTSYLPSITEKKRFLDQSYGNLENAIKMADLLKRSQLDPVEVLKLELDFFQLKLNLDVIKTAAITTKYSGYIERSLRENERMRTIGKKKLNWEKIVKSRNISNECRQRIQDIRPETFGQLQRMDGIRPATLAYIAGNLI